MVYHSIIADKTYVQNILAHNVCIANSVTNYLALKFCKCLPLNFDIVMVLTLLWFWRVLNVTVHHAKSGYVCFVLSLSLNM